MGDLELKSAFACALGQSLDLAMVEVATTIKHAGDHLLFLGELGKLLSDPLCRLDPFLPLNADRRGGNNGVSLGIVDQLGVDRLVAAENGKPGLRLGSLDSFADTAMPAISTENFGCGHKLEFRMGKWNAV